LSNSGGSYDTFYAIRLLATSFLTHRGSIDSGISKLGPPPSKKAQGLVGDIEELAEAIRRYPWTTLTALKGDPHVLAKLEETEKLLKDLRKTLSR